MKNEQFCMSPQYKTNKYLAFDDTSYTDQYQKDVYQTALNLVGISGKNILDVGCGSGYKLVNMFAEHCTVGLEIEPTLSFLRKKYPNHQWLTSDFSKPWVGYEDVVICSDVVEHLVDPDILMNWLKDIDTPFVVISTPDRDTLGDSPIGPPQNKCHVREWNKTEFTLYCGKFFSIVNHTLSGNTQIVILRKKEQR